MMRIACFLLVMLLAICTLFGCVEQTIDEIDFSMESSSDIEASAFETSSSKGPGSSTSDTTQPKPEENQKGTISPPALSPDIYTRLAEQPQYYPPTAIIAVNNDDAQIVDLLGFGPLAAWEDYLIGIGDDRFTQIYHLSTGEIYDSSCWSFENTRFFSNGVAAIFNYQDSQIDGNSNISQVLLMDQYCVAIEHQLQFDYGSENEYGLGNEYLILDVAYQSEDDKYVAVFSRNPYFISNSDEIYDNTVCQLGIAVFASDGKQLLRYELDGVLHPLNTKQGKNAAKLPLLYLLDAETVLIVPQTPESMAFAYRIFEEPLEGYSSDPLLLNLSTHAFRRLSIQEMQSLLEENDELAGEQHHVYQYWEMSKPLNYPFTLQSQDDNLLVYGKDERLPLFVIPDNYSRLVFSHEYEGLYYLMFC